MFRQKSYASVVGEVVMSRGGSNLLSNGRMAWAIAVMAVAVLVALPVPSEAQSDRSSGARQRPVGPASGDSRGGRGSSPDLFDFRDAIANSMVVGQPDTPGALPLTSNEVVCLAGCDRGPGTVVYRDGPQPSLASISAPTPLNPGQLHTAAVPVEAQQKSQQIGVMSCVAGCYELPKLRTVASLREAVTARRAAPVRVVSHPKPVTRTDAEPVVVAAPAVAAEPVAAQSNAEPAARLRSAFSPTGTSPTVRSLTSKSRMRPYAKAKGRRGHQYGKVVSVTTAPAPAAARTEPKIVKPAPAAAAAERDVPQEAPAKVDIVKPDTPEAPVTKFAPPRRPERRKPEQAGKQAAASNDWFNKINREQEAAKKRAETARD